MTFATLTETLSQMTRRRRQRDALIWVPRGLLIGLLLAVVVATIARFRPLLTNAELGWVALALALLGVAISAVILLLQRYSISQQADFADRQFGLQERAITAVELHDGAISTSAELQQQQLNDALTATGRIQLDRDLPYELKRQDWALILLAIALLMIAIFLDNPQVPSLLQQRATDAAVAEQAAALEEIADEIEENEALSAEQQEQLLEPVESALEAFEEGDLTQEEALATLSETESELRELASELSNEPLQQALQSAGESLAQQESSQSLGEALQNGDLAQSSTEAALMSEVLEGLTPEEQAQLAEQLATSAEALSETDSELSEQLAEAAEALADGDTNSAEEALDQTSQTLAERNEAQQQNQQAAQQAQSSADQVSQNRNQVAQAGQQSGNQPNQQTSGQQGEQGQSGQGQQGQQGQQGEGQQGQQGQQGEGQQGEGQQAGNGQTGNQPGSGQQSGNGSGAGAGGAGQGGGSSDNVFVPDTLDLSEFEGVDVELDADCFGGGDECGELQNETPAEFTDEGGSIVPYTQVLGDYQGAVNEALSDNAIPLGYKQFIRDYFSSLEPER